MRAGWIRFNLSIALGASLVAHGGLIYWSARKQIAAGFARLMTGSKADVELIYYTEKEPDPPFDLDLHLGDWSGSGHAIADAVGDEPMAGRRGSEDQPLLSRDPVGQGRIGDAPTQYTGPTGRGGDSLAKLRQSVVPSPAVGQRIMPMQFPLEAPVVIRPHPQPVIGQGNAPASQPAAGPTVIASAGATPEQSARSSGAPTRSADPAPMADSEIDLFSKSPVIEFRQGKAKVQFGRKMRVTRPHIPLVGVMDAFASGRKVTVGLMLRIDETGNVVNARVGLSGGSNEIDNPVRREAYNWWADPGEPDHPLPREFPLRVAIYD